MNEFSRELISICRFFGVFERDAICCGSVTVPQCVVLQELLRGRSQTPPERHDISSLATLTGVSNSAMTRLVDGLEKRSWVERRRTAQDRRRVFVELQPSGVTEAERLRDMTSLCVDSVLKHIAIDKQPQVLEAMRLVRSALEKAQGEGEGRCC